MLWSSLNCTFYIAQECDITHQIYNSLPAQMDDSKIQNLSSIAIKCNEACIMVDLYFGITELNR